MPQDLEFKIVKDAMKKRFEQASVRVNDVDLNMFTRKYINKIRPGFAYGAFSPVNLGVIDLIIEVYSQGRASG